MEEVLNKIDLNNLDKSTWESYTFEEIVFRISETVDPNKTDLPIYVGLEHIDAEDIHIRRKGTPDDVSGQKLKCYPGDIIFGKRRAYQRKAAIVDFEGICSAHAFVLRANPTVIDPQLFPFFLHSDQFMHRMVDISVGGLSPTINWGDLKHQEFLLPPKEQQTQLAELLWAMDEVIEKEKEVFVKIILLENSIRNSEIDILKAEELELDNLLVPSSEIKIGKIEKTLYNDYGKFPIIDQSMEFIIGYSDDEKLVYKGDLPVIVFGDHTTILKFIDFPFIMGADGTKIIKPTNKVDIKYLFHALKKINIQPQGYRRHFSILKNEKIKIPESREWVKSFTTKMDIMELQKNNINFKIQSSQSLQKSIINQVF